MFKNKNPINESQLRELYTNQNLSAKVIGNMLSRSKNAVYRAIKKYDIPVILGSKIKGKVSKNKNKTFEELYGIEKAIIFKEKMSNSLKNKTYEELYGEEKATIIKRKISDGKIGNKNPMFGVHRMGINSPNFGKKHTEKTKTNNSKRLKDKTYEDLYGVEKANEIREKISRKHKGIPKSKEHNRKNSEAHKGCKNPNYHKHPSEETLKKLHEKRWKGGPKISRRRFKARRRILGYIPLNESFEGSEGHHIDKEHVIFIPKELHRSIPHALKRPKSIERINTKVYCWLLSGINC